jgi:hypothetical protein
MCTAPPDCHAACMPPHTHCHGTCTCVCRVANHRPLRATQSVRVKPEQQKIELTFPLDTSSEYYDPVAGRAIATATVDEDGGDDDDDDDGDGRVTTPTPPRALALSLSSFTSGISSQWTVSTSSHLTTTAARLSFLSSLPHPSLSFALSRQGATQFISPSSHIHSSLAHSRALLSPTRRWLTHSLPFLLLTYTRRWLTHGFCCVLLRQ